MNLKTISSLIVAISFIVQTTRGYDYYVAEFTGPAFGTIEFHPQRGGGIRIKSVLRSDTTSFAHWLHIHEKVVQPGADCATAGGHVDTWSVTDAQYACQPDNKHACEVGDLSGKFGPVNLGPDPESLSYALQDVVDYNLDLSNLTSRSLVLHSANLGEDRFACASLVGMIYPGYLSVNFSDTYYGAMVFRTRSDGTMGVIHKLQTHLGESLQHQWHIHNNPVDQNQNGSMCFETGDHFDPEGVENGAFYTGPPRVCDQPVDQSVCFYGDLEGKYGQLALTVPLGEHDGVTDLSAQDMQLYLPEIFDGKSVVIHQSGDRPEMILCDTLAPQEFTEAVAVFDGPVSGEMYFKMHHDGTMRISYSLRNTDNSHSTLHSVHVHMDNVVNGECGKTSAGGHYDPAGVEITGYMCDPIVDIETCYKGDLSGKYGKLDFPADSSFHDTQLTVSEIIGRSIVIHESNGAARYACATISPTAALPELGVAEFDHDGLSGYVFFREQTNGRVYIFSNVDAESGSNVDIEITEESTYERDCWTSGEIYDSLSNRFHFKIGQESDTLTSLSGLRVPAVVDRSIIVSDGSNRIGCSSISKYPVVNYARAAFTGSIWGSIDFRMFGEETMISFNLNHNSGTDIDMRWYIASDAVQNHNCHLLNGVWDPFMIGDSMCIQNAFSTCRTGDLSSKHGDLVFPAAGWMLDGSFSVTDIVGRSVVIERNGQPQACATIKPEIFETELAAAEFIQSLVLFRRGSDDTRVVYSIGGPTQTPANVFIKDSCEETSTDAFSANVERPSMFVESTERKIKDLVGKFMEIGDECVEITEVMGNSNILDLDAVAYFNDDLMGSMEFTRTSNQTDRLDGFELEIDLENADGTLSQRHKMHIHDYPVLLADGCASAGGHYDPLGTEISSYNCDPSEPIATCYYGDLSGRYEIKFPFSIQTTLYDSDVPLADMLGRSVVIHAKDNGGPRYDCATIFPIPKLSTTTTPGLNTMAPTSSAPTRSPTPFSPTESPPPSTSTPTTSPTESGAGVDDSLETAQTSESGSDTGLILGIILPLVFCCICIWGFLGYRRYKERDLPDALKSKPLCDFECPDITCPSFCPQLCRKGSSNKSAFHLGRYNNPKSTFNAAPPTLSMSSASTLIHKCPHGLKTFTVDEADWFCSTCRKEVPIGETMMGCRICDVDKCNECCEKARKAERALSTPPVIPSVPNGLKPHRNSRLEMKPPSRDTSREPSPVKEYGEKGLPKILPSARMSSYKTIAPELPSSRPKIETHSESYDSLSSSFPKSGEISLPGFMRNHTKNGFKVSVTSSGSSEGLPTTVKKPPTLPRAPPPRMPGKRPKAPPAKPKAPPSILPQAPPNLPKAPPMEMVREVSPPPMPAMIRSNVSTYEKKGALGTVGSAAESVYTLPDDPNTLPPDVPIPPRSFQHSNALATALE